MFGGYTVHVWLVCTDLSILRIYCIYVCLVCTDLSILRIYCIYVCLVCTDLSILRIYCKCLPCLYRSFNFEDILYMFGLSVQIFQF